MKVQIWVRTKKDCISQRDILIGAFLGIADSFVEIMTLGKVSIDLRFQWAFRCAEKEYPREGKNVV